MTKHTWKWSDLPLCRVLIGLIIVTGTGTANCDMDSVSKEGWYLNSGAGVIHFIQRERNAAVVSRYTTGGNGFVEMMQRPIPFFGIGVRGEMLGIPSAEKDAGMTWGGRAMISLNVFFPVKKLEFIGTVETGYSLLRRRVEFENASKVLFHGATFGLSLGVLRQISARVSMGFVLRFSEMLSTLSCTEYRCHVPHRGRNPGPSLLMGLQGSFRLQK